MTASRQIDDVAAAPRSFVHYCNPPLTGASPMPGCVDCYAPREKLSTSIYACKITVNCNRRAGTEYGTRAETHRGSPRDSLSLARHRQIFSAKFIAVCSEQRSTSTAVSAPSNNPMMMEPSAARAAVEALNDNARGGDITHNPERIAS